MTSKHTSQLYVRVEEMDQGVTIQANGKSVFETVTDAMLQTNGSQSSSRRYVCIGLGGQSKPALLQRKARLGSGSGPWNISDLARYLEIDNDLADKDKFAEHEFKSWDNVPAGDFLLSELEHPGRYPGLARFGNLRQLYRNLGPIKVVGNGNRGIRQIGGLVQEYQAEMNSSQLEADLITPVEDLLRPVNGDQAVRNRRLDGSDAEPVTIWYFLGTGGSAGTPPFQPLGWLQHHLLANKGIKVRLMATFYLPELLKTSNQELLLANTEAFFRELAATYDDDISLPPMKIGRHWVDRWPVFSLIKLVNAVDEQGRVYDYDDVHAIDAICWQLSSFGPIADHLESRLPNILGSQRWPFIGFSQNCQIVVVPVDELKQLFALRQQQWQFDHLLQQPQPEAAKQRMRELAYKWLEAQQITPQAIAKRLTTNVNSSIIEAEIMAHKRLKLAVLKPTLAKYLQKKVALEQEAQEKVVDEHDVQLAAALIEQISDLFRQPDASPQTARYFLEADPESGIQGLQVYLTDLQNLLERRLKQEQAELERHLVKMAKPAFILIRMFNRLFPQKYKGKLLKNTIIALTRHRQVLRLRAQVELVKRLARQVQSHSQALAALETVLERGSQRADEDYRQLAQQRRHRPVYEQNILSAAEEEALFNERRQTAFSLANQGVSICWQANRWVLRCGLGEEPLSFDPQRLDTRAGLEQFRSQYLQGFWADLDELNIEAILENRGEDPVKFIERLKRKSSPLISVNHVAYKEQQAGGEPIELRREYILGAPFGKSRFFQDYACPNGFEIVNTGERDKHRIILLNSVFHVSLLALAQSESYRNAYQRLTAAGHNLHIFDPGELGLT